MRTQNNHTPSSDYLKHLGQRIATAASLVGGKKRLSKDAGISESHLYRCIRGTSATTIEPLLAIAKAADVSLEWLLTGQGDMQHTDVTTTAGSLINVTPLRIKGKQSHRVLTISELWLDQHQLSQDGLRYCISESNSMSPTIPSGSTLFIDTLDFRLSEGGVYAFLHTGNLMIRRLQWADASSIWMLTDNPAFQATLLNTSQLKKSDILGRVVSSFQEV